MIKFIPFKSDRVVGIRFDGKIDGSELATALVPLKARLERHDNIRLYLEINDFEGMTAEAFFKDVKFSLSNARQIEKEAVVTDQTWLKNSAAVIGAVFPGVDVKTFTMAENEAARQWITTGLEQ
tara:strand:+ start:78 stop:449 length:372 start_codon:yes stop_codon:yes gene_type:complete